MFSIISRVLKMWIRTWKYRERMWHRSGLDFRVYKICYLSWSKSYLFLWRNNVFFSLRWALLEVFKLHKNEKLFQKWEFLIRTYLLRQEILKLIVKNSITRGSFIKLFFFWENSPIFRHFKLKKLIFWTNQGALRKKWMKKIIEH